MGRAVSWDVLVLLWSQLFPSSLTFGLISPLTPPPGTNLFPTFTILCRAPRRRDTGCASVEGRLLQDHPAEAFG